MNKGPNPWNFSNEDANLTSPNGLYKIEYGDLGEIAMGGPDRGEASLIIDKNKIALDKSCGGPAIWNNLSNKVAIPVWTINRAQQIGVVDIENLTMTYFKELFYVLLFSQFENNIILGIDSPKYQTAELKFNICEEEIEKVVALK